MANSRLQKSGLFDTVVVTSRRDLRSFSREQENTGPAASESRALDDAARADIARVPNVIEVTPDIRFITELRYDEKPHLTMVVGHGGDGLLRPADVARRRGAIHAGHQHVGAWAGQPANGAAGPRGGTCSQHDHH